MPKAGTTQSSYTVHSILGTGNKCTICGGKRPKEVKKVTKGGGKAYRGIRYIKNVCVYAPLYCLCSKTIAQIVHRKARRKCRRISTPNGNQPDGVAEHLCGARASQVQSQLWDPAVLEQWLAAIATPSHLVAHMGMAGPHNMGTELKCSWSRRRSSWPTPGNARASSTPSRGRGDNGVGIARTSTAPTSETTGRHPGGLTLRRPLSKGRGNLTATGAQHTTHSTRLYTQPSRIAFPRVQDIPAIAIW